MTGICANVCGKEMMMSWLSMFRISTTSNDADGAVRLYKLSPSLLGSVAKALRGKQVEVMIIGDAACI